MIPDDIRATAEALFRRVDKELWRAPADIIADALLAERERAAKILQPWKSLDHLSLHVGEVTAQEFRTVVAVLISCQGQIRSTDKANTP